MSNKLFYIVVVLLVVGVLGLGMAKKEPDTPRPGVEHADDGRTHVASKEYTGDEPPTSGEHAEPVAWGVYDQEIPEANAIHNLEHGGVYISYRSDLPKEEQDKIKALFSKPYANPEFTPSKALVAPRDENKSPIVMSSWRRSQTFERFDEAAMINYYKENVGKSPEPGAS